MVHSYFEGMIPKTGCTVEDKVPSITIKIFKGEWPSHIDNQIGETLTYTDTYNRPFVIKEGDYEAKDNFIITVTYQWYYS